jgi:CxxC motif-containing protein
MIKKILCKLGFHKYERTDTMLTHSVCTTVECKRCGHSLSSSNLKTRKEIDKEFVETFMKELP